MPRELAKLKREIKKYSNFIIMLKRKLLLPDRTSHIAHSPRSTPRKVKILILK